MSEQNSMAISPVTAGIIGAGAGAIAGGTIKALQPKLSGYGDAKALLTMEKDSFEKISKPGDGAAEDIKTSYSTIEEGRKIISEAGDTLEKTNTEALEKHFEAESKFKLENFKHGEKGKEKSIKELETEVKNAKDAVKVDDNDDVKAKQKALDDAKAKVDVKKETDALENAKKAVPAGATATPEQQKAIDDAQAALDKKIADGTKAEQEALDNAKKTVLDGDDNLKKAVKALDDANAERTKQMKDALKAAADAETDKTNGAANKLLKQLEEKFDAGKKADELLKDTKYGTAFDKLKGLMPHSKWKGAAIGAAILGAAGVALAYIVGPKNQTPTDVA